MVPALANSGRLALVVFRGEFDGRLFIRSMPRLRKQAPGKAYIIADGRPSYPSVVAGQLGRCVVPGLARCRRIRRQQLRA